ncbi:protein piwi-like [Phlebotomus argentipes]|uniref:protein piwi-like n=1 Tax=Phlebotomus argentipes TaxID=94469 RepID=UPI00289341A0|nr:protein piwi-like [Phlebotomus argentipes]
MSTMYTSKRSTSADPTPAQLNPRWTTERCRPRDFPPYFIFFYRDGVGDGDISHVMDFEVKKLASDLKRMYGPKPPKLTFIVVSKQINTRFFRKNPRSGVQNPPSGTVVDDMITLPERYDFFLVSQSTRSGTISPASYNVIFDESGLSPDRIQIWTYKMTHLYYNWSGNVKVPAVCQYAQKLALLVGQYIHQDPSNLLETQLYFL